MLLNDLAIWCMKYVAADLSINGRFSFIFFILLLLYCAGNLEILNSVLQFEGKVKT